MNTILRMNLKKYSQKYGKNWGEHNPGLFPLESIITDSALFKASPLHKLTDEQYQAKRKIMNKVVKVLKSDKMGRVIFVSGEAGTGKTVLNSSIFYDLNPELFMIIRPAVAYAA